MKAATSPDGTGGNPKIGVPVSFHRSSSNSCFRLSSSLSSPSFLSHSSQVSGPLSAPLLPAAPVLPFASCLHAFCTRQSSHHPPPYSITIKIIFYLTQLTPMKTFEHPPCPRRSSRLRPKASPCVRKGTGNTPTPNPHPHSSTITNPNPSRSLSWSSPIVTAAHDPLSSAQSDSFLSLSRSPPQQDRIRQDIIRQDKT